MNKPLATDDDGWSKHVLQTVVVDFLRTVVCLLLSRPFVKRKQHKVMKELTKNKNKVNLIPDRRQANVKDNL